MQQIDYNEISKIYDDVREGDIVLINHFLGELPENQALNILDVGCGTGNYTDLLQKVTQARSWQIYGLDPSEGMIDKARKKNSNIVFQRGRVEDLLWAHDFFDFVYMTDVIFDPRVVNRIGEIFYSRFHEAAPDFIVTMETKGIPPAMMTARAFNLPLVIIRDAGRVTEGSSVSINYISGSTQRIQTMTLSRRALPEGARVLIIDDFMKGGGTAKGMQDLMAEFKAQVVGTGVVVSTRDPREKLVRDFYALLELVEIDDAKKEIIIRPAVKEL
jgi:xanthine phosphoribosyltransferase